MPPRPRVLLCFLDATRARSLGETLARDGFDVATCDEGLPDAYACEVIVADRTDWSRVPRKLRAAQSRGFVGLVLINMNCGADVVLPADCTAREVSLSCKLLTEVVRLRRERHRGRGTHRRLLRLANQDPLTRLANRRLWDRELALRLSPETQSAAAVAILDVDTFKQLNTELGLPAGDRVLAAIGVSLMATLRPDDLAARLGGDEFGLLLVGTESAHMPTIVERVRRTCGEAASRAAGRPVSLSAGVAVAAGAASDQIIGAADRALRTAKSSGRDRTCHDQGPF